MTDIINFEKKAKFQISDDIPHIEIKPNRELDSHELVLWGEVKKKVYNRLLPEGLSQRLADEFLEEFKPLFTILLPVNLLIPNVEEGDPDFESWGSSFAECKESINDHLVRVLGGTLYNQLTAFLMREFKVQAARKEKEPDQ